MKKATKRLSELYDELEECRFLGEEPSHKLLQEIVDLEFELNNLGAIGEDHAKG